MNLTETIKAARSTSPALLVLDYTLPDMSARRYQHALAEAHLAACRQMITGG